MNEINSHIPIYDERKTPLVKQKAPQNIDKKIKKIAATIQNPISPHESKIAKSNFENTQKTGKPKSGNQVKPIFLFGGREITEDVYLDFALLDIGGKQKLLPVTTDMLGNNYKLYKGSPLEALFKLSQEGIKKAYYVVSKNTESPIKFVLNNSNIREADFFYFLFEKDQNGTPRIHTLNASCLLDVLKLIEEKKIAVNLHVTDSKGATLLNRWAGKGNTPLTRIILKMAPIIIKQALQTNEYLFANTVFGCYKKEAGLLLNAMEKQHIKLSQEDQWMKKALKADYKFSDKEFAQLPQELKSKFFYCANAMGVKPLVRRLRSLGMKKVPLKIPGPPSTFAFNTDIIRTRILMRKFLKDLRKQGALLTEKEFNRLDRTQYVEKSNQIGRIQGKNFIEKLVKENGFQHIKVPKKMMVMYGNPDSLSLYIHYTGELLPNTTDHEYIKVYAERIEPVDRKLSLEEAIEWMIMLEKTGFQDFSGENFFICKDGIYFIDTEFENFKPSKPKFFNIQSIKNRLDSRDVPAFLEELKKREKAFEKKVTPEFIIHGTDMLLVGYAKKLKFTFPLKSLAE